jgi:myosin-crossreactive antigen
MDQTLKKYLGLTPDESIELIKLLIKNTKAVNGTFISLWHNESINNFNNWKGWQKVYLEMMEMAGGNL